MKNCSECGREVSEKEIVTEIVESGYSSQKSPPMGYKEVELCPECWEKIEKKSKIKKVASAIVLLVVVGFLLLGLSILFLG